MRVALIQTNLHWEDKYKNIVQFEAYFKELEQCDIVCLPEMFTTGFSMLSRELSEKPDGPTIQWLSQMSKIYNRTFIGSIIVNSNNNFYNRLYMVTPDDILYYDKKHLFRLSLEHENYTPGNERKIFNYKGINITPNICYDLRFPIWCRTKSEIMIFVANWPEIRIDHWNTLLKARAIENQCFVIGVNRTGSSNSIKYNGMSSVYDHTGKCITYLDNKCGIIYADINIDEIYKYRDTFPTWKDADNYQII